MTTARPSRARSARSRSRAPKALAAGTPAPRERWAGAPRPRLAGEPRVLNVTADVFDLRDRQYQPMLAALPATCDFRREVPDRDSHEVNLEIIIYFSKTAR